MSEPVWNISEVNAAVKDLLESAMMPFWLCGEIGTLTTHRSGHVYMVLKDSNCQLKATWFNGANKARELQLAIGSRVEAYGKITCYPARGEYQFNIKEVRIAGQGDLLRQFEQIKQKLDSEGLFADERKKRLPLYPKRVGLITAPEGAAVRDFIRLSLERFPSAKIAVYPSTMQGGNTVKEVCRGIDFLVRSQRVDTIVICRGGGSMEDLWAFNDESLARKIASCPIPVVSAIGHEVDFTICDFVADYRASTPSAAAEILFSNYGELCNRFSRAEQDLRAVLNRRMQMAFYRCERAVGHYILREPKHLVELKQQQIDEIEQRLKVCSNQQLVNVQHRLGVLNTQLTALNPYALLERGFSMVQDENNHIVTKADDSLLGKKLKIYLADGGIISEVKEIL